MLDVVGSELVFDIGANHGSKAALFSRLAKKVICVEPDPTSFEILRSRFARRESVVLVHAGVAAAEGTLPFRILGPGSPLNTFSAQWASQLSTDPVTEVDVSVITLDQLIREYGLPNYVKIDAEGYELPILKGLSVPVPLLSFECNLPDFLDESLASVERLATLSASVTFNYSVTDSVTELEEGTWVDAAQISEIMRTGGQTFLEVFARMPGPFKHNRAN